MNRHSIAMQSAFLALLIVVLLSFSGCGGSDNAGQTQPVNTTPAPAPQSDILAAREGASIRITNRGSSVVGFYLSVNGKSFFATVDDVIRDIRNMPSEYPDEPDYRKLWRYVSKNKYHFDSYTDHIWSHSPVLFFNSLGFGFCDDVASVYYYLVTRMGYQARIWNVLSADFEFGHVIPEVWINGRWEMYDPALEVFYWNDQGQVAGVEEIASNIALITEPINPFPLSHFSESVISAEEGGIPYAYSQYFANVYAGVDNHKIDNGYYVQVGFPIFNHPFSLPPKAYLEFPVQSDITVRTESGVDVPNYHLLRMVLPKGWSGALKIPFVFLSVSGSGHISLNGTPHALGSPSVADRLLIHDYIYEASILVSHSDIEILLLVNKTRFDLNNIQSLEVRESSSK